MQENFASFVRIFNQVVVNIFASYKNLHPLTLPRLSIVFARDLFIRSAEKNKSLQSSLTLINGKI